MSKKAFFLESTLEPFDNTICAKCGLEIAKIQDGRMFWNPNPHATDKNICQNCYEVWKNERKEGFLKWQEKYSELTNPKECTMISETLKKIIIEEVGIKEFRQIEKNVKKELEERKTNKQEN